MDGFKTLAPWPLQDFDLGGGEGRRAERGTLGKDGGIILRQDLLNKHTWVYTGWKCMGSWLEGELIKRVAVLTSFSLQQPPRAASALDIKAQIRSFNLIVMLSLTSTR